MQAKTFLIPLAAFALTATGVSAFNSEVLERAGLSQKQISAFETAHELRKAGDREAARDALIQAGIDLERMESVREAMHEYKHELHSAMHDALGSGDYEVFKIAIEGSPIADLVTTKESFALFKEAYDLHKEGEHAEAQEIMDDLGFEHGAFKHGFGRTMHSNSMRAVLFNKSE